MTDFRGKEKLRAYIAQGHAALETCRAMKKPFLLLLSIYLLGVSAILRADFNYIDDMGRAYAGYKGWGFGRHLSNSLSGFVHADNFLTDISPLPQILAVLILAFCGMMALYLVTGNEPGTRWGGVIALIPLGLSPYMLECLSYKYDAPYMALSVFAAIAPLLFRKRDPFTYLCAVLLGTLAMCMTYQASAGIFPMMTVLLAYFMWNRKEPAARILSFLALSAAGYLVGLFWFKLFLLRPQSGYLDASIAPAGQLPRVILENYRRYFTLIRSDLKGGWLLLVALLCIAFLYRGVRTSGQNKAAALLVSTAVLAVMLLLSFGIYPAVRQPLFDPRAMYGAGVFAALVAVSVTASMRFRPAELLCLILGWCFFVFAFTYGNALSVQKTYTDFRIRMVIDDLRAQDILLSDHTKTVKIAGTIGHAPSLRRMPQDYQILNRLVPVTFCERWHWGYYGIAHYYGLKNLRWLYEAEEDWSGYDLPVLADTVYHTIRGDQEHILIELK